MGSHDRRSGGARLTKPRVVVVGLGPGGPEYVTNDTLAHVEALRHRYLRTALHPSAVVVRGATSFDHFYESAASFAEVYERITDELVAAAREHGEVLYAVPGSPLVLERTVRRLLDRAGGPDETPVEIEVRPAMSFLDVVWARLGVDPVEAGVRLVDGHTFATSAAGDTGPLLVAHCHANWVLSEVKLAVEDANGDEPVVILQRLGTATEAIVETTWAELDRTVIADHLTSVYVPELAAPVARELQRFHQLARTLRERCPWDRVQTHRSLVPYLLEETYEVVDALGALGTGEASADDALVEELGDLLYQIEFHATIAEQEGRFTMADVARGIHDKLVRRHPHVFAEGGEAGDVDADTVVATWDEIKRAERAERGGEHSVFDGVPRALPSLAYASAVLKRAAKAGHATVESEPGQAGIDDIGAELWALVVEARRRGVDAEVLLREVANSFRGQVEAAAARRANG